MTTDRPPMLDLNISCLTAPVRMDLVSIEAMMLWPTDPSARDIWWRAAALEEGLDHIDKLPIDALRQYARDAMLIPRVDELNKRNKHRIEHGLILGITVYEAAYLAKNDPNRAALYKVQQDLSHRLKGMFQIEPRTMNNKEGPLWPMKPAAHLWAAHILRLALTGDTTFPCRKEDIGTFLALAETIRLAAEQRRAPKANSTVMRVGSSVVLPSGIVSQLPQVIGHF